MAGTNKKFWTQENFINHILQKKLKKLSTKYVYNNKAWMSSNIFQHISSRINELGRNTKKFIPGR